MRKTIIALALLSLAVGAHSTAEYDGGGGGDPSEQQSYAAAIYVPPGAPQELPGVLVIGKAQGAQGAYTTIIQGGMGPFSRTEATQDRLVAKNELLLRILKDKATTPDMRCSAGRTGQLGNTTSLSDADSRWLAAEAMFKTATAANAITGIGSGQSAMLELLTSTIMGKNADGAPAFQYVITYMDGGSEHYAVRTNAMFTTDPLEPTATNLVQGDGKPQGCPP